MEVWPYGWFQKKNILQADFKEKHFSYENSYTEKKNLSWCIILEKKNLTPVYVREKNDITRGLEKKLLPKANHS